MRQLRSPHLDDLGDLLHLLLVHWRSSLQEGDKLFRRKHVVEKSRLGIDQSSGVEVEWIHSESLGRTASRRPTRKGVAATRSYQQSSNSSLQRRSTRSRLFLDSIGLRLVIIVVDRREERQFIDRTSS